MINTSALSEMATEAYNQSDFILDVGLNEIYFAQN